MAKLFGDLVNEAVDRAKHVVVPGMETPIDLDYIEKQTTLLNKLMSTKGEKVGVSLNMKEALWSADASILFPKVFNDILMRPKEPLMIGQTLLAKTIQVDNVRLVEFPTIGAIRAYDVADGQEFRNGSSLSM